MNTIKTLFRGMLLISLLLLLAACGGGGGGGAGGQSDSGAGSAPSSGQSVVTVRIGFPGSSTALFGALDFRAMSAASDVASITLEVRDSGSNVIATQAMTLNAGVWEATLVNLPVGEPLTFNAFAYDSGAVLIFSGTTVDTLANVPETVTIYLNPAGGTIGLPQITGISIPAQIENNDTQTVTFGLASGTTPLDFAITSGGGSFSPATGSVSLPGGTATLNSDYTAPSATGTYSHSIRFTNADQYAVQQAFQTVIVPAVTDVTVSVLFAPVLTALVVERTPFNGSNVVWTATVDDEVLPLNVTFDWSFAGTAGVSFSDPAANPATLTGYDPTVSGVVTLVLTDGDGLSTTITYNLPAGQFPDF